MAWDQKFVPAVPLPTGGELVTLDDARAHILALPGKTAELPAWQNATEALLIVGQHGGDPMLPRIGMMQALYPSGERVFDHSRKASRWTKVKLLRDR